ncbi:PREDICTED: RRP15-like protein [Ceratosolen solmsi marchali]|uniref:RRP15-like protein n=1 Tax=Ceratosolen solmsi marchali TaxID=326594 RepID=A0AAJ7DWB4_9HYME|nr:PREDICTED: RRP15-like protein [Ceratosolen solmsi marchali]
MIAHDVSVKNKKSLKKVSVQVPVVKESEDSDSKEFDDSDAEKAGTDSPNEELENRKNITTDDETSSGAEGDESDANDDDELNNVNSTLNQNNPHWADAMKKVLGTKKPKRKKSIVLSKAKKINEILPKPKEVVLPFEIETNEGKIKTETVEVTEKIIKDENLATQKKQRRKILGKKIRVKPSVLDRDYEKRLQKIATSGVVQLFNAVKQQQKDIENKIIEAGPLERKREKALKSINRQTFLNVLMGGTNNLVEDSAKKLDKEDEPKKENEVWSVLRDDFVMGAKMKDWNKDNKSSDEDSSPPEEMDSD